MNSGSGDSRFILYGTSACHLCEVAEHMLESLRLSRAGFDFEKVDIAGNDALFERYGMRIPVLMGPDGRELGWPFSAAQLAEFASA